MGNEASSPEPSPKEKTFSQFDFSSPDYIRRLPDNSKTLL
jgi:hypothetical protein